MFSRLSNIVLDDFFSSSSLERSLWLSLPSFFPNLILSSFAYVVIIPVVFDIVSSSDFLGSNFSTKGASSSIWSPGSNPIAY